MTLRDAYNPFPSFSLLLPFAYSPSFIGYCSVLSVITSSDYEISWTDFCLYSFPIARNFPSVWELIVSINPQTNFNLLNYESG